MAVLYIGSIYPPGKINELKKLGSVIDFAAETFQTSLLQGLSESYPKLKIITSPNISSYPKIDVKRFDSANFNLSFSPETHFFTGFINIPLIKNISKILRIRKLIRKNIDKKGDNIILIYGVHSPFLLSLLGLKRNNIKTCLIVPDLPEYMNSCKNKFFIMAKKIDRKIINWSLKYIDCFVLFSPYMKDCLPIDNKPWVNVEGILDTKQIINDDIEKENFKTVLYTGSLKAKMGIVDLIKAFSLIQDSNYRLWIRGNGELKNFVLDCCRKDPRIIYFDSMSKSELLKLQKRATVLINPVFSTQIFTKYFFPSKTMEYLASGTPTIMARLACLPPEYESHLYFFDHEDIQGIKDKLIEICNKDKIELKKFGEIASEFVIKEKNQSVQAKKIVNLINNLKSHVSI